MNPLTLIDTNLYLGSCPFRSLEYAHSAQRLLKDTGTPKAIFTSFSSLFYQDSLRGLKQDMKCCKNPGHTMFFHGVINPSWPGWRQDLIEMLSLKGIVSVKLFPSLHHYSLKSPAVEEVCRMSHDHGVPLVLMRKLVDERLTPKWIHLEPWNPEELKSFLDKHPTEKIVLNQFHISELLNLKDWISNRVDLFPEIGVFTPQPFQYETFLPAWPGASWIYGSGAPMFYHLGGRLALQEAGLPRELKKNILVRNAKRCFQI